MTIKQQGGIFGRNPTFNDLTAGSGSSIEGSGGNVTFSVDRTDASTAGALVLRAANGNLSIDSDGADKDILIRTGGSTERARFYGDSGDFSIKGNLVIDSGQGIDFSATSGTGTSELFSDYEEGTFTPAFLASSTNFSSITYDPFVYGGRYTKVGNVVFFSLGLRTDAITVGSASGEIRITGLPYTSAASDANSDGYHSFPIGTTSAWGGDYPTVALIAPNKDYLVLQYKTAYNVDNANLDVSDFATGANSNTIRITGCYFAA